MKGGELLKLYVDLQKVLQEKTEIIFKYLIKIGADSRDAEDILQEAFRASVLGVTMDPMKY